MPPVPSSSLPFLTRTMLSFEQTVTFALRIDMQADEAVTLALRGMTREATFEYKATTPSNSQISQQTFALSDIPIMVTIEDSARALEQGQCFVSISLVANGVVIQQLTSGYIYAQKALSWPNTQQVDLRPGGGRLEFKVGADPTAGNPAEITVPTGEIWYIRAASITLTTDATVATRRVYMEISPTSGVVVPAISLNTQAASDTESYKFAPFGVESTLIASFHNEVNMPEDLFCDAGGSILFKAVNLQAGDNFGSPLLTIEKFFITA